MNTGHEPVPGAAPPVAHLIEEFNKLPGIGPKSAQRLTYYIIRLPNEEAQSLVDAIVSVKDKTIFCSQCQNITENNPCNICSDPNRENNQICVVEEPLDILAMERAHCYKGMYHVLHGVISPMDGIGPEDLKLKELLARLKDGNVKEVIIATNPIVEGEATAMYIQRLIVPLGLRVTRLARGLPVGSDLEYADGDTLTRAFDGRQEI